MNAVRLVLCLGVLSAPVLCQDEFASECPELNGYFADAFQCDKYYSCTDGVLKEKLCADGMVFQDLNPRVEKCDFPFHITCEGRPELQPPHPSKNCPRLHGYFPHADDTVCNKFYFCAAGIGSQITCPESLVFSLKTGTCVWPDEAGRTGCTSQNVLNFTCPKVPFDIAVAHPRYPDIDDCQYFYVCINGETPRRNGCKFGTVFNSETKACDEPINVPDCKDYYKEYFEEYFANIGTVANIPNADILAAAIGSGFTIPDKPKRVKINLSAPSSPSIPTRRRRPSQTAPAADTITAEDVPAARKPGSPKRPPVERDPVSSRRTLASGTRRRPLRKQQITTTTTTPTPAPEELYDYYDYDYPANEAPPAA